MNTPMTKNKLSDEIFSVNIFPDGVSRVEHKIIFETLDEKQLYISGENKYTKQAYDAYLIGTGPEREKAREKMMAKRVEYAKKVGYGPLKNHLRTWIKLPETPKEVA